MCRSSRRNACALLSSLTPFIHFSPACHVFVILLAQPLHHFVGGLASGECSQHGHRRRMPARSTRYARLAGLTKQRNVQEQLLDLARGWTAIAVVSRVFRTFGFG